MMAANSSASSRRRLPLQDLALAPASLRAYSSQLHSFLTHTRLSLTALYRARPSYVDDRLARYIQHSYNSFAPFSYAAHTLHAVVFHRPDLKLRLPQARQCLRGWERVRIFTSHPPLTWEVTVVLALTMAQSGHHAAAVSMLVAFDCYLRVGELTRLRRCDVVMPHDSRMGAAHERRMAVILPTTKTGPNQSVALQSKQVAKVLRRWMRMQAQTGAVDSDRLFPFSPAHLRHLMHDACTAHGLSSSYVPHSLRHGGATADFLRTGSIEHVQFRGRWKSMESSRRYIQQARAMLAAQTVPQHINSMGVQLSSDLAASMRIALSSPPAPTPRQRRVRFRL